LLQAKSIWLKTPVPANEFLETPKLELAKKVDMPIPEIRTRWAEEQAEQLLAIPFISEFVFRSPQNLSGARSTQREVADHLILHRGKGLLVSQKAQEDPESRNDRKNGFVPLDPYP
jgi:hypothetical protein